MEENKNSFPSLLEECGFILKIVFVSTIFLCGAAAYLVSLYHRDLHLAYAVGGASTLLWSYLAARAVPLDLRRETNTRFNPFFFLLPTLSSFGTSYLTVYLLKRGEYTVGVTTLALGIALIHWGNARYQRRIQRGGTEL